MTPNPLLLGTEIGGTKLQLGLGRGDGKLLALERRTIIPENGAEGVRSQLLEAFGALIANVGLEQVAAIGVGFGGPVDVVEGVVTTSHQVKGWNGFPLAQWLREKVGTPEVIVQNDADTAGLAEARFGSGKGISPVLYVTIGSGIGGGLIIDGKIYRGGGAGAIEIGHLWVNDRTNSDLGVVTLEESASGWAIAAAARAYADRRHSVGRDADWPVVCLAGGDITAITTKNVVEAATQGDFEARMILDRATTAMAHGLGQAVTLLAPRRIILGGGVSLAREDRWLNPIRRKLDACVFPPFRGTFDLMPAVLGEEVVIHGALALASDLLLNKAC